MNDSNDVKQKTIARQIVQSIIEFGVNEKQLLYIIKLLALELENNSIMTKIVELVNDDQQTTLTKENKIFY